MTPEQNSYIAALSYCKEFRYSNLKDQTLGDIVKRSGIKDNPPEGFGDEQWQSLLDQVKNSSATSGLILEDVTVNSVDGGAMITLKNPATHEAVIAFQGTATPEGWDEDLKSGYTLTNSQREAIGYAQRQAEALGDGRDVKRGLTPLGISNALAGAMRGTARSISDARSAMTEADENLAQSMATSQGPTAGGARAGHQRR